VFLEAFTITVTEALKRGDKHTLKNIEDIKNEEDANKN
jgi:hypothetical protein